MTSTKFESKPLFTRQQLTALLLPDCRHTYRLTDGSVYQTLRTSETNPQTVLELAGRPLLGSDRLSVQSRPGATDLQIHRARMVSIQADGATIMAECAADTVGGVLEAECARVLSDFFRSVRKK